MKHTYDEYDFEKLYADVNDTYFGYTCVIRDIDSCYDTYTGSSEDYYSDWN